METNHHLFLLYDENCPFCAWYTGKFVNCGLLSAQSRIPYSIGVQLDELHFDRDLARNKIALVDTETGATTYGIDSLLRILGQKIPLIETIGTFKPIHWFLEQFYNFISYNRKAIAPIHVCETNCACEPDVSYFWRIFYIAVAGIIVHLSVGFYFTHFLSNYLVMNHLTDIYLYVAQFGVQFLVFKAFGKRNFYQYAGHLATTSLIGALILTGIGSVLTILNQFGINTEFLAPLGFGVVLTAMFVIHFKRTHQLSYGKVLTFSWVLFRIGIYFLVFKQF